MKTLTRKTISITLSTGFIIILLFLNSCNGCFNPDVLPDDTLPGTEGFTKESREKAVSSIDKAIESLDATSANWLDILKKLISDLPKEVKSTITNEVSNLLTRTVAASNATALCTEDFIQNRMKQALQRIKSKLFKSNSSAFRTSGMLHQTRSY